MTFIEHIHTKNDALKQVDELIQLGHLSRTALMAALRVIGTNAPSRPKGKDL